MNRFALALLVFATALTPGCAVSTDSPRPPAAAPVTPASDQVALPRTIAVLPFRNRTGSELAERVVRRTVANHLSTRNYRMLHWRDVDSRLALAGIDDADTLARTPDAELRQVLGVDGLVHGDITHYDKTFAGVYAQIAVGVEVSLTNADDRTVWQSKEVRRSHAGGVSASPVGLLMNALAAGKHLLGDLNLYRAADDVGRALAEAMPQPAALTQKTRPTVTNVVHNGVGRVLAYGDVLEIGLEGDPGLVAAASIDGIGIVDLIEVEPGQYVGQLSLGRTQNALDAAVTGALQDSFGQVTSWVSPYGLVNIDNTPPGPPANVSTRSRDGAIEVVWTAPPDADVAGYRVGVANSSTGAPSVIVEADSETATIDGVANFGTVWISVTAYDGAGNESEPARVSAASAPDTRFSAAAALANTLPDRIDGLYRMTAESSPYYLRAPSTVTGAGVLLIGPGVTIIVSPRARLTVLGELHVFGSGPQPVRIASADARLFDEFLVLAGQADVSIRGLSVKGAGIPIQVLAGSPEISDCVLTGSAFNALSIGGSARPTLVRNVFEGAGASGVVISGQAQPTFRGNQFRNNDPFHVQNGSTYRVELEGNTFEPGASPATILGDASY